jgi:hypothetical protein
MPTKPADSGRRLLQLTDDEIAVVELYRVLGLQRAEALRRLATPESSPILPLGQELQANMPVVAEDLSSAEGESAPSPEGR